VQRRGLIGALLAAWIVLFAPRVAFAQRVLLVRLPDPDTALSEAFNRLRAELALQGFEVDLVEPEAGDSSPDALARLATKEGALAGISLTRRIGAPAAEVCIADRVTGKISMRTLELHEGPDAPSVLAVRAADLLRSSLREFAADQKPPPDVVGVETTPVPDVVQRFARPPTPRFRIDAGATALGVGLRIGPGYAPGLGLSYRVVPRVGLGIALAGPAIGASYGTNDGVALVTQEIALARVWVAILQNGPFELRGLAAAGVYHLDAHGDVAPPLASKSDQVTSFAGGLGLALDLRMTGRIVWTVEGSALALTPQPAVALLTNQYAFAPPFTTVSTGIGVDF
jgi:hypothetical protein